jgi:hypothetical protein
METLLEKAFEQAATLSEGERESFARFILDEIESEKKWEALYKKSESQLKSMASEAIDEFEKGNTEELDFSKFPVPAAKQREQRGIDF